MISTEGDISCGFKKLDAIGMIGVVRIQRV